MVIGDPRGHGDRRYPLRSDLLGLTADRSGGVFDLGVDVATQLRDQPTGGAGVDAEAFAQCLRGDRALVLLPVQHIFSPRSMKHVLLPCTRTIPMTPRACRGRRSPGTRASLRGQRALIHHRRFMRILRGA